MLTWIQTFTGKRFDLLDPRPESICVEDIAHALSMLCRFTGHVREFYSVAQHCVHVSEACEPPAALFGLLHDASEAYLGDVSSPLKRLPASAGYRVLERRIQRAIYDRFDLHLEQPACVHAADRDLLVTEAFALLSPVLPEWGEWVDLARVELRPLESWSPRRAEWEFLRRFLELTGDQRSASDLMGRRFVA